MLSLRAFMFERVYLGPQAAPEHEQGARGRACDLRPPRRARRRRRRDRRLHLGDDRPLRARPTPTRSERRRAPPRLGARSESRRRGRRTRSPRAAPSLASACLPAAARRSPARSRSSASIVGLPIAARAAAASRRSSSIDRSDAFRQAGKSGGGRVLDGDMQLVAKSEQARVRSEIHDVAVEVGSRS